MNGATIVTSYTVGAYKIKVNKKIKKYPMSEFGYSIKKKDELKVIA